MNWRGVRVRPLFKLDDGTDEAAAFWWREGDRAVCPIAFGSFFWGEPVDAGEAAGFELLGEGDGGEEGSPGLAGLGDADRGEDEHRVPAAGGSGEDEFAAFWQAAEETEDAGDGFPVEVDEYAETGDEYGLGEVEWAVGESGGEVFVFEIDAEKGEVGGIGEFGTLEEAEFGGLARGLIGLHDVEVFRPFGLAPGKGVDPGAEKQILPHATPIGFVQAILRIPAAEHHVGAHGDTAGQEEVFAPIIDVIDVGLAQELEDRLVAQ